MSVFTNWIPDFLLSAHHRRTLYRAKATYWALPITPRLSQSTCLAGYRSSAPWITMISHIGLLSYSVGEYRWISRPLWLRGFPAAGKRSDPPFWAPFPNSSGEVLGDFSPS